MTGSPCGGAGRGARTGNGRRRRRPHHGQQDLLGLARGLGAEAFEEPDPLAPHPFEVAGHSAVVTDQPALVGAGGGGVRVVDLHRDRLPAGRRGPVPERPPVLAKQKALRKPDIHMLPGQPPIHGDRAQIVLARHPGFGFPALERLFPDIPAQLLIPTVETGSEAEGDLDEPRHPDVAAGEDPFEVTDPPVVGAEPEAVLPGALPEEILLPPDFGHGVLGAPLKRGVGLRNMARNRNRDPHPTFRFPVADAAGLPAHVGDSEDILVLFGGEPDHEVELGPVPAPRKDPAAGLVDVRLADILVDHIAHPLGTGLGSEGESGRLHLRDVVQNFLGKAVGAQTGDSERNAAGDELAHHLPDERRDAGVVRGGERGQRRLVVTALFHRRDHRLDDRLRVPLAHRAVDHPRLAEAAALGAAAGDLHRRPVEDRLGGGHRGVVGEREPVHIVEEGALDPQRHPRAARPRYMGEARTGTDFPLVERRAVEAAAGLEAPQRLLAVPDSGLAEPGVLAHEFGQTLFGVPDEKGVHEGRHRLGLGCDRTPGDHERMPGAALPAAEGDPAEIQHGQHVREGQLVLQRKAHDVEIRQRAPGFEADEREAAFAQLLLHVRPGAKHPLEREIGFVVHRLVEDLRPEVAHPDVIHIGEAQRHPGHDSDVGLLHHRKPLAPGIARRARYLVEEAGVGMAVVAHGVGRGAAHCRGRLHSGWMTDRHTTLPTASSLGPGPIRIHHPEGTFVPTPASRIALRAIARNAGRIRGRGLDWGSGTGLLAIAAARIAAVEEVLGLELDPLNIAAAGENAARNGVRDKVRFVESDSFRPCSPAGRRVLDGFLGAADFLLSNPPASGPASDGFEFRREVVRGAGRYLKPGALLFLSVSTQYGMERLRGLSRVDPGFRYRGVAATSDWMRFDMDRPDLRRNVLTYAGEEERGGLRYCFRDPRNPKTRLTAVEARDRYRACGESPLSRWQSHLFVRAR